MPAIRIHAGFLIANCPVLYVESGDVLTLFAGIAIVIFVAVVANPQYLSGLQDFSGIPPNTTETISPPSVPATAAPYYPDQIPVITSGTAKA